MADDAALRRRIRRPSGHWTLFFFLLLVLSLALLMEGYARHDLGRSSTAASGRPVPAHFGLATAGSVIDFSGPRPRSIGPARRTVALTFDDGPDPTWTPQILAVLERYHVPATFFVVGSRVVRNPGIVRREVLEGDEIGAHTFTHSDLGALPGWRQNLESSLTQTAITGATGFHTSLLRMPYSSEPSALTLPEFHAAQNASRHGYLLVFADRDSEDWRLPGVRRIVTNATPLHGSGAIVLMHDGGGVRRQTVRALGPLIRRLRARGYRFETVSQVAGVPGRQAMAPASSGDRLRGIALIDAMRVAFGIGAAIALITITVLTLLVLRSLILVTLARRHLRRRALRPEVRGSLPPASIVVPAFNEAVGIERSLRSLVASEYPDFDVLVVDDGSTDRTAEIVRELPDPKIRLVSQANLGKAAALQTGISATAHPIVVTVDADTIFQPSTLRALVEPFVDPKVGAVSGNTKVGNRRGLIGRWQHIEYVIGFNLDRRAFDVLDCITTVPGAVGAFRREALESVGGFSEDTLAEDTDVTMALNRAGWRVSYEDRAIAWTEAPATWSELWKQRYRWAYGTMQSIWKHRGALWRGEGHLRRALPYVLFFNVITPLFAPIIDLFALYGLVFLNPWLILAYWGGLNVLQLGVAVYAFRLDGERLRPLWAFPLQQLLYRQVMYLVMVQSAVSAFQGIRLGWHKLTRTGSVEVTS